MTYNFYTDGAASMRKDENGEYIREAGGWAFALFENDIPVYSDSGHEDKTTNQKMELTAILETLKYYIDKKLRNGDIVNIHSDSAYCVNIFTQWVNGWKANNWTRKGGKPIENLEIIKLINAYIINLNNHFVNVNFIKVKGHTDNPFNNYVDELAVSAKGGKTVRGKRRFTSALEDSSNLKTFNIE